MRLSTREVNVQGRLSKSPTQLDWSVLSSSPESWPPLLPSFSTETVEALDRFIQGFICKRIEYRCGQLSATEYTESFLPQWITVAERRTDLMEDFFAQQGTHLEEEIFQRVFGAFERLQSALRDARQEHGDDREERHDKKITFARPVAHRLIRRSRDRFSLRSVADADDSVESSTRLSSSPRMLEVRDTLHGSLQLTSLSPPPHRGDGGASYYEDESDEERAIALPVEDSPDGDHFTGRASGVYYGGAFQSARSSTNGSSDGFGLSSVPAVADVPTLENGGGKVASACGEVQTNNKEGSSTLQLFARVADVCRGPVLHSAAWRRWWIILFYYVVIPASLIWYCLAARFKAAPLF